MTGNKRIGNKKIGNSIQPVYQLCGLTLLLLLGSCAATIAKPRLYFLTSTPAVQGAVGAQASACAPIAVSVQLAAYLERDGLILQLGDNELVAADSHLWAEPLVYGVERLLNVCLNPTNAADGVGSQAAKQVQKQVKVVVEQLHGNAQGVSRLQATWSQLNAKGSEQGSAQRFSGQADQAKPGYDALVSAQRGLLLDLCQQIASTVSHCAN